MKIVIVGLGVIGGSFAMALKKAGYDEIYGIDTNEETLQKAKRMGIIKGAGTTDELYEADLIILALYPRLIKTFIMNHGHRLKPGCVITDATGIKGMFIDDILEMLPSEVDFVFGHPMAGREKKGIDFASDQVFKGANYLITPTKKIKKRILHSSNSSRMKWDLKKSEKFHLLAMMK